MERSADYEYQAQQESIAASYFTEELTVHLSELFANYKTVYDFILDYVSPEKPLIKSSIAYSITDHADEYITLVVSASYDNYDDYPDID